MFAQCPLRVRLTLTAALVLLVGGAAARPAHANITSLVVSQGTVSGGLAVVSVTVTVDVDTPWLYLGLDVRQPQRGGLLARGSRSFSLYNLPAGVPVSWTVTVSPSNTGPFFQTGVADFALSAYTYDPYYQEARTGGTVVLKKAR